MYYETNECCGCAVPGYPCVGDSCPLRHTPHYNCDICDEPIEDDNAYSDGFNHYCEGCYIEMLCEFEEIDCVRSLDDIKDDTLREMFRKELKANKIK